MVSRYSNIDAPLMIIVAGNDKRSLNHRANEFWIQDCSAAIETMILSATELGPGSCWCGLFPRVTPVKRVREIRRLEDFIIPLTMIYIGYPDEEKEPRTQYDVKEFISLIS